MLTSESLRINVTGEIERASGFIRHVVMQRYRRRGVVLGLSGGIDSSAVAALCVRALGKERVFGLLMPEKESSPESTRLGRMLVAHLGIDSALEDITPTLEACGCYRNRDVALAQVIAAYRPGDRSKIVLPPVTESDMYRVFSAVVQSADGVEHRARLTPEGYLGILAATNFKQRVRKMMEYSYADRLQYAVAGTPNRLEYDQGFFVKGGDGLADLKPIAHLYKTQVYAVAEALGVPAEICARPPTTDTYSLPQSQEEFYFSLPHQKMDLCLYARDHGYAPAEAAAALGLTKEQVERVYRDVDSKRRAAAYLHAPAVTVEAVEGGVR